VSGTDITVLAKDGGRFSAYLAVPASGSGPGIVLIQEIFGVNAVMRGIAEDLAAEGFLVLCPDLFWRQEPGVQISDKTQAEWDKAFKLMQGFNLDKGIDDLTSTLAHLRQQKGCTGKVGAVGYCLGGQLAYLMACRTTSDASVGYYGVMIQNFLSESKSIKKPLMLHIAEEDAFVPKEDQAKIKDGLTSNRNVTIHSYPGCDHAFARVGGQHYDKDAATLANKRTLNFFKRHLG
jgi:carboxymethylenebutenolidase